MPFPSIQEHHPIDDSCSTRSDVPDPPAAGNDAAHALLNEAKNNFCSTGSTGSPALVTFSSFKKLQKTLDQKASAALHWDRDHLPADRSIFRHLYTTSEGDSIGEGFSAWVMKLRKGSGESCNCGKTKKDETDMHIVLIDGRVSVRHQCYRIGA